MVTEMTHVSHLEICSCEAGKKQAGSTVPDSDMTAKSVQILRNSAAGMLMVEAYSVSGIPKCS